MYYICVYLCIEYLMNISFSGLEPLWDATPSVFLMNLQRLCPHYFCSQCAKRIVLEQTSLGLQNFQQDMSIGSEA